MPLKRNRTLKQDALQLKKMASGIRKYYGNKNKVLVKGKWILPEELAQDADKYGDDLLNLIRLSQELTNETARIESEAKARAELSKRIDALAVAACGGVDWSHDPTDLKWLNDPNRPPIMEDFGLSDRKTPPAKTMLEIKAIVEKRNQTRKTLGTKGKRQKQAALEEARQQAIVAEALAAAAAPTPGDDPAKK